MLGSALLRVLAANSRHEVVGTLRSAALRSHFSPSLGDRLIDDIDAENPDDLARAMEHAQPDAVVNCVGVIKKFAVDPLVAIPINAVLPHRLGQLCAQASARLVHISTDCVFSGRQGAYKESDFPDADDLYGRSKLLGEPDLPNAVTLRTSMIGEELQSANGLVNWFLAQQGRVAGYSRAIFSGLPTVELSRVIIEHVLPLPDLTGIYHVAADPISKYDLIGLVNTFYHKGVSIEPTAIPVIDRSLDGSRFAAATGYKAAGWPKLIQQMHDFHARKL